MTWLYYSPFIYLTISILAVALEHGAVSFKRARGTLRDDWYKLNKKGEDDSKESPARFYFCTFLFWPFGLFWILFWCPAGSLGTHLGKRKNNTDPEESP